MRPSLPSAVALALSCASCEAFHMRVRSAGLRSPRRSATRGNRVTRMEASSSSSSSTAPPVEADGHSLNSNAGATIPRVGGAMPEQRPGWFRVPAPGGKHTKVWFSLLCRTCLGGKKWRERQYLPHTFRPDGDGHISDNSFRRRCAGWTSLVSFTRTGSRINFSASRTVQVTPLVSPI